MKYKAVTIVSFFLLAVCVALFTPTQAAAESDFFGQYCAACHTNDTPTCNGCHAHGVWQNSSRQVINLTATTDLDQYQPGQTVTVTFSGGYRQGWIRAILYDHNSQEVDRVTGPTSSGDDGSGSSDQQFPVLLSAAAPSTPGFYTWSVSWFGSPFDTNNSNTYPHVEENVLTNQFEVLSSQACQDADGDGYEDAACNADPANGGGDCDDGDPSINPGQTEVPYNGVDDDCDPSTLDDDFDGDGYGAAVDCDDADPAVNPGATELCDDGIDNDCDGLTDSADSDCSSPGAGFSQISLTSPANLSVLSSPPTFVWTVDGGANNGFRVDITNFSACWSTENMQQPINDTSWTLPQSAWNRIPAGTRVYWRVRGADLDQNPRDVVISDEAWSFYKE